MDQIERLLRTAHSARDKAIIAVLLDTGLRANELCTLTLDHVHFTPEGTWLLVHGKRDKWREVGLGKRTPQALHKYIYRERPTQAWRAQGREREHVYWVATVAQEKDIVHLPLSEPYAGFPVGYDGHELWAELNERDARQRAR